MLSVIVMIFLKYGAGMHGGKGDSTSGWVFFELFFGILILAYIAYKTHLKKEEKKNQERRDGKIK